MPPRPPLLTCLGWLWALVGAFLVLLQIWFIGTAADSAHRMFAVLFLLPALGIGSLMMFEGAMLLRRSRTARTVALFASGGMCFAAVVAVGCVALLTPLANYQHGGDLQLHDFLIVLGPIVVGLLGPPTWAILVLDADVVNAFPRVPVARLPVPPAPPDQRQPHQY